MVVVRSSATLATVLQRLAEVPGVAEDNRCAHNRLTCGDSHNDLTAVPLARLSLVH